MRIGCDGAGRAGEADFGLVGVGIFAMEELVSGTGAVVLLLTAGLAGDLSLEEMLCFSLFSVTIALLGLPLERDCGRIERSRG